MGGELLNPNFQHLFDAMTRPVSVKTESLVSALIHEYVFVQKIILTFLKKLF